MTSKVLTQYNSKIVKFLESCSIPKTSTVFKGTLYENTVLRELEYKFHNPTGLTAGVSSGQNNSITNLGIIGGSFDHGIDIVGTLLRMQRVKFLVQCKCFSKSKVTGKEIRELVGATSMYKTVNSQFESVSILASPNSITKDGIHVMNAVPIPLIYLQISMLNTDDLDRSGQLLTMYENDCSFKKYGFSKFTLN